jgi:hypothetical protein
VSCRQIDDASAAEAAADAPRHFPGFVQFLPRQTSRLADRARQPIEERIALKPSEVPPGEAGLRRHREMPVTGNPDTSRRFTRVGHADFVLGVVISSPVD